MQNNIFSNMEGIRQAVSRAQKHLLPPPDLKPSEWAQEYIRIPAGNAVPGPLRLDNAPYQREPMDMLVDPDCYRVTLMWGAQVGKTLLALCVQAYCIGAEPCSQMMMQPSQDDLRTWLETKFNPLAEECEPVTNSLAKPRGRDGVNNQKMKSYPGGFLMFAWSGSPKTMRGRSAPKIVCDEVDGYERTSEGHPVGLLWQRSATFGDQRFLLEISTPTLKNESYIEKAFEMGDQRHFYVCCPHCDDQVTLSWENVHWLGQRETDEENLQHIDDQKPDTAHMKCPSCGSTWNDGERVAAIRQAESKGAGWKSSKPFDGHASYHLNELYSTFRKVPAIVRDYLDKLKTDDLQTFTNVSLARTWEEKGEKVDPDGLMARREEYAAQVPAGGVYLTAGIDMQNDRLELEIVAWGVGEESWSVDYRVLWGDTLGDEVWDELDDVLAEKFMHETGFMLPISAACLDTGGTSGHTQRAYEYAKGKTGRRLFAIKGQGGWGRPVVAQPQRKQSGKNKRKVDLFMVGTDETKLIVTRRLAVPDPGKPGYCHFPENESHETEYFKQLTAEKLTTRYVKGQPVREWTKPDKARNEALDCRVYATAALKIMQPPLSRISERLNGVKPRSVVEKVAEIEPVQPIQQPANDNKVIIIRKKKPQDESKIELGHNGSIKKKRIFGNRKR